MFQINNTNLGVPEQSPVMPPGRVITVSPRSFKLYAVVIKYFTILKTKALLDSLVTSCISSSINTSNIGQAVTMECSTHLTLGIVWRR